MKKCTKCGETKAESEFHKHKKTKDGLRSDCKICVRTVNRKYNQSSLGKAVAKKYKQSELGVAVAKKSRAKYNKSPNGKAVSKKYEEAPKRRAIERERSRKIKLSLATSYVACRLGMRVGQVNSKLIELKREQLEIYRLTKQLNKEIQNGTE